MIHSLKDLDRNKMKLAWAKFSLSTSQRLSIYKKIAVFLEEQVPLDVILMKLSDAYTKLSPSDARGIMLGEWYKDIENGKKLSQAMASWVPPGEAMLIRAGEQSDDLGVAFLNALDSTQASKDMKGAIIGSLAYPCILFTMLFFIVYMFSTQAVPELVETLDPASWPDATKKLYVLSQFVESYWWTVLLAIVGGTYALGWSLGNVTGSVRLILDKIPPWSMYKSFQSSIFLISSASMLKTGIPLFESFKGLKKMSSKYVASHLDIIMTKMEEGAKNGEALDSGFLDKETGIDISIFSQTDNIQDAMDSIGRASIKNSIERINAISGALNIIAMMCVTGFIGWIYYCFWALSQSMGNVVG
ncbi:type II secretion system F family protein [Psychromonas sp. SP041]|uniref:type II secretion system F family protein n=1 Tax=Psychromonas sp. SP041 TaxID=1365007 RepID=UPI0010C7A4D4|nr:type II secretion system F family protein [Psychromonas sp. SP041]